MTIAEVAHADPFPFIHDGPLGCGTRHGHVIVTPGTRTEWRVWGDQIFIDEATANVTAARCVSGACDILPAREVLHYTGKPGTLKFRRSILVDWARMGKTSQ